MSMITWCKVVSGVKIGNVLRWLHPLWSFQNQLSVRWEITSFKGDQLPKSGLHTTKCCLLHINRMDFEQEKNHKHLRWFFRFSWLVDHIVLSLLDICSNNHFSNTFSFSSFHRLVPKMQQIQLPKIRVPQALIPNKNICTVL